MGCLLLLAVGVFLIGNDYRMKERRESIPTSGATLSALIAHPENDEVKGTIVFVHGDGPQEASQDGGYKPLMERFARQGYVSVSWDKPGTGRSSGDWLSQSMEDRAQEANEVISWLKENYPHETRNIGLWGASQAGWVVPKVMHERSDISFAFLVGPAINWMRQGEYNTGWQALNAGGTEQDAASARESFKEDGLLIAQCASYDEYKDAGGQETMTPQRYQFVRKNMDQDATSALSKIQGKVYLVLAEDDKNVDSAETARVYASEIKPDQISVKTIPGVEHRMLNPKIAQNEALVGLAALMLPKSALIDKNYLDYCEEVLAAQ